MQEVGLISQESFFDLGITIDYQFAEPAGDGKNRVFYEYPKISKLILSTTMENEMLDGRKKVNEDNLKCFIFKLNPNLGTVVSFLGLSGKDSLEQI